MPQSLLRRVSAVLPAVAIASAAWLAATPAHAMPVTTAFQTLNFCVNCGNRALVRGDENPVVVYPSFSNGSAFTLFNTGLGTLQRVELVWSSGLFGTLTDDGQTFSGSLAKLMLDVSITLNLPGSVDVTAMTDHAETNGTIGNGTVTGSISEASSSSRSYTAPADLANFLGTGTFGATFGLTMTQESDNGTRARASWGAEPGSTAGTGVLSLRYVYDDGTTPPPTNLPEPNAGVLAAVAALLGVAGSLRAMQRSK